MMNPGRKTLIGLLTCTWIVGLLLWGVTSLAATSAPAASESKSKPTSTPRFKITAGKGYGFCEGFLKHLNALPATAPPPSCDLKLDRMPAGYTLPQWEALDWRQHLDWIHTMERHVAGPNPKGEALLKMSFDEWKADYLKRVSSGELAPSLRRTTLALNEKGPEVIFNYDRDPGRCAKTIKQGILWGRSGGLHFVMFDGSPPQFLTVRSESRQFQYWLLLFHGKPYFAQLFAETSWSLHLSSVFRRLPATAGVEPPGEYVMGHQICHIGLNQKPTKK
jgi:hypothetical protein